MGANPMKAVICGGRNFSDYQQLRSVLQQYHLTHIIHGGARGADSLAGLYAGEHNIQCTVFKAEWNLHGLGAGPRRNQRMLEEQPEVVIAFPGGFGTADMVRRAKNAGLYVIEVGNMYAKAPEGWQGVEA